VKTPPLESVASGGYGPNQVSTILGLGMFALFVRLFIPYKNFFLRILMYAFLAFFSYRALATLSRGGVFTSLIMCLVFVVSYYNFSREQVKAKQIFRLSAIALAALAIWLVSLTQTNNMLYNKYTNRNANGMKQEDFSSGRFTIIETELDTFVENPIFGIGAGMGKFYRLELFGEIKASHNEITRLLSEHGVFGIISVLLLIGIPFFHYLNDTRNIFIIPFLLFWLITISHSSMRIAAPGVFYGLALLSVNVKKRGR
jgi:O-antigen ligase